ncbi:protocadherin gamma-C5 isoform X1 [Oryzias melastigma]|uniref:protocadherin gamma-C5 isoform X1 n=1 Tax=Oryzias melastigma TaxID=30732 RepID=UPI00168D5EC6|nr:protocadherin gamma-C5 isoform X1 [Oryzias melastigma]
MTVLYKEINSTPSRFQHSISQCARAEARRENARTRWLLDSDFYCLFFNNSTRNICFSVWVLIQFTWILLLGINHFNRPGCTRGGQKRMGYREWRWQALWWHHFFLLWSTTDGQTRYSIPEELKQGSVVGNVAKDLGLGLSEIFERKLRVASEAGEQYFSVDAGRGELLVNDRIDREALCAQSASCVLPLQIVTENPLQLHRIEVEIKDINDNYPVFLTEERFLKIAESTATGVRFPLDPAEDLDVGSNSVKIYTLSKNECFSLKMKDLSGDRQVPELVLDKSLDREKQSVHHLLLIASDGGNPVKTGTAKITVSVMDNNDNVPVFKMPFYNVTVPENGVVGSVLVRVEATDADEGVNGEIEYVFAEHTPQSLQSVFKIDQEKGDISLLEPLDYEKGAMYEIRITARDKGVPQMEGHCRVQIMVMDLNDNVPEIVLTSKPNPVQEDSPKGTVVALINARDQDSGNNGKVRLKITNGSPFALKPSFSNNYALITNGALDREIFSEYKVEITATDSGSPPLSSIKMITVSITDVNDNPPVFTQKSYIVYLKENGVPGCILFSVSASDLDSGENAKISYSILDSKVQDVSVSSYVYMNSENGSIYSMHSFDYEKLKVFEIHVQAKDQGSPSLSSNATVHVFILDQNDNAPAVIYPSSAALGSLSHQRMPRSAKAGHLVTKVTAVDADSGHNAWISYRLAEATDASLFSVNLYTGEVRTKRAVSEQDDSSQRLILEIKDDGEPLQSATVTVSILLEDALHEPISELRLHKASEPSKKSGRITLYLILSLASVSVLSLLTFVILAVKCMRSSRSSGSCCCMRRQDSEDHKNPNRNLQIQLNTDGPIKYVEVLGGDMMSQSQSFRSCMSPMSEYSDFTLIKPSSTTDFKEVISVLDASLPDSTWTFESQQQKPPNNDWRFTQGQRPGPSGPHMPYGTHIRWTPKSGTRATGGPEVAMGTGPWPQPPTEAEQLQALMAAANEVSEATATLGPGTMGLSTRYSPQFTLQHVPDYRQNVYIPGSTATLTSNPQQQQQATAQQATQQALPPPQASAQSEPPKAVQTPASKKKSTKKEKK